MHICTYEWDVVIIVSLCSSSYMYLYFHCTSQFNGLRDTFVDTCISTSGKIEGCSFTQGHMQCASLAGSSEMHTRVKLYSVLWCSVCVKVVPLSLSSLYTCVLSDGPFEDFFTNVLHFGNRVAW